jgi:AraC-like DNA-binding protein
MELARSSLLASDATLAAIAAAVGYSTEFAFSKAFKRTFGVAPAVFRRTAFALRASMKSPALCRAA